MKNYSKWVWMLYHTHADIEIKIIEIYLCSFTILIVEMSSFS